ncbi:alpha/beta fold hydrolase [Hasllibacter sp. MH4015]|uniref:alpha/beta fold hydrolase n=1 Tax=Hasllibacter sp. MH4015 TaxID=2854029 RepID=UPI001CD319F1|nr:alpha/beta hydrolase [Hasllibacter sp. MH4015]
MAIEGLAASRVSTNGIELSVHRAGQGKPLILLHGFPQNHRCWEKVAPRLAEEFDVIVPDLRGYGDSDAPEGAAVYAKREMAKDIVGLMDALGLDRAHILGHDRGARVSYRLALDHPARVDRLGIIEIVPTGDFWAAWDADLALAAYHWTFLAQAAPMPERMILADGPGYIDFTLASWTHGKDLSVFSDAALESYRAQGADPARVAAMCNDYRAGATLDRRIDAESRASGDRIAAPLLFVWAEGGFPARTGDPLGVWRDWAADVRGCALANSGHFAMEEVPQAVLDAVLPHFREA